jgi:hypothetical protein
MCCLFKDCIKILKINESQNRLHVLPKIKKKTDLNIAKSDFKQFNKRELRELVNVALYEYEQ